MKSFSHITLTAACLLSLNSINAQTEKFANEAVTDNAKTQFVKNQNYLSPSSLKNYKNTYGDSLKGFDEKAVKVFIIENNSTAEESVNVMNFFKRDYINKKYALGEYSPDFKLPTSVIPDNTQPNGNSKIIGGGGNITNVAPCNNEDFEASPVGQVVGATGLQGWYVESRGYNTSCSGAYSPGSSEVWVEQTPIVNTSLNNGATLTGLTSLGNSPLGGNKILHLHNKNPTGLHTRISQQFPVTASNSIFQLAFAGEWQDAGHTCCQQPVLDIKLETCGGTPLACASLSFNAYSSSGCPTGASGVYTIATGCSWTSWQVRYIDLSPYIGQCIKITVLNGDCEQGGHYGVLYFDAACGSSPVCPSCNIPPTAGPGYVPGPVSFCQGSGVAQLSAPVGYNSYQWIGPAGYSVAASQSSLSTISVSPPPPVGSVYTVNMTSPSGCPYFSTMAIQYSSVSIAGIGTETSCIGGASGQATVIGNGSGGGYNYNWVNSANVTVGTNSIATGLAPGIYSVTISGLNASGCGTSTSTLTIGSGIPSMKTVLKPYCGSQAFIAPSIPGTNHHWYNGMTAIPAPFGTAPSITVAAVNNATYYLGYDAQGCHDSIAFVLQQSPAGSISVPAVSAVCPNQSNGTATISMNPAPNSPSGLNTFSVYSIGTTPAYISSVSPTGSNIYVPTGMAAGAYSVFAFDGSCMYGTSFILSSLVYDFTITPASASLCPLGYTTLNSTFSGGVNASQVTYAWSPSSFLTNPSGQSTGVNNPTTTPGTSTSYVYTLTTTSLNGGCQVAHTATVTAFDALAPTLSPVPNMCNTSGLFALSSNPSGAVYSSSIPNLVSPSGVITPSNIGNNYGVVTYTATLTNFTCSAASTGTFEVSKFNEPDLIGTVSPLCVIDSPINLMGIVQNTTGVWSGTGVQSLGAGNYEFNPSGLTTNNYPITYNTYSSPNPTVCPSFTTIQVSVTNTMVPNITPVDPFCDNAAPITLTASPAGGIWTGVGVSAAGVVVPGPALVPSTQLTYSVVVGPCTNTNSITLSVSHFNSAAIVAPIPHLCGHTANSSLPFDLMSITTSTSGTWSGIAVNSNSFNPAGLPTGVYGFTFNTSSWPNPSLCSDSRTTSAFVLNPPSVNIIQPPTLCSTSPTLQMQISPVESGSWIATQALNPQGVFNPALAAIGNNPVQYATGTQTCINTVSISVSVEAFVSAATTTNSLGDKCNTGSMVNLTPVPYNANGVWSGPGIIGSSFDPSTTGIGSFILTYHTASSPSGLCPDESTLSVNVYSLATPVITQIGPLCNSSGAIQIPVTPIGGVFGGVNTSAVSPSGVFNPPLGTVGNNIVNYSITSGPCVAYAQLTVSIESFVSADFTNPKLTFCKNEAAVDLNSMVQNPGGTWSGNGVVGSMFTPAHAVTGIPNIITYRTHSTPTESLCPDEKTLPIDVRELPQLSIISDKSKGCAPVHVVLSIETSSITSGFMTWYLGEGSESQEGLTAEYTYNTPGVYHVTYNYSDDFGCKAAPGELGHTITVYKMPKADFSAPTEILISNPEVIFTNLSADLSSSTYSWSIPELYQSTDLNATVTFPAVGRYPVTLVATAAGAAGGCYDAVTKIVDVKSDFNIYIPNSFTPNDDQLNDIFVPVFSPYGEQVQNYEMEVYDRWGHLLFRTKDISKGWDGSFKGEAVKEEVYIYRIKFKAPNGDLFNRTGSFTLLR